MIYPDKGWLLAEVMCPLQASCSSFPSPPPATQASPPTLLVADTEEKGTLEGLVLATECLPWKWHSWASAPSSLVSWQQEVQPTMCPRGAGNIWWSAWWLPWFLKVSSPNSNQRILLRCRWQSLPLLKILQWLLMTLLLKSRIFSFFPLTFSFCLYI